MTRIYEAFRVAASNDRKVTWEEWETNIKPILAATPLTASREADGAIATLRKGTFADMMEPAVRADLDAMLIARGYPIQRLGEASGVLNVTRSDDVLHKLLDLVGRGQETGLVGVLDNGFDVNHPALAGRIHSTPDAPNGHDFLDGDGNVAGDELPSHHAFGHGTHVAAVATGGTDRIKAVLGRVLGQREPGDPDARLAEAIDRTCRAGAPVVNMSLGGIMPVPKTIEAMKRHPNVLFVVSAGNTPGTHLGVWPFTKERYLAAADLPNMVTVSASDVSHGIAPFSTTGGTLAAPGTSVFSAIDADPTNPSSATYAEKDGTSMAAPRVAAVAAQMKLLYPRFTAPQLKAALIATAWKSDVWKDKTEAGGILEENSALKLAALLQLMDQGISIDDPRLFRGHGLNATDEQEALLRREAVRIRDLQPPALGWTVTPGQ